MKFNNWKLNDLVKYLGTLRINGVAYFDYTKEIYVSGEIICRQDDADAFDMFDKEDKP